MVTLLQSPWGLAEPESWRAQLHVEHSVSCDTSSVASGPSHIFITPTWERPRVRLGLGEREPVDILRDPHFSYQRAESHWTRFWDSFILGELFAKLVALGILLL